ncbi:MAG: hypothetical protein M1817_001690 [Caeruleum heppii]|nr:MAG: hypothetical protein M1817_001690 [Caeruleum heppii]
MVLELIVADKYRLVRKLGGGAFAVVYLGLDLRTKVEVALKLEHVEGADLLHYEAEILQELGGKPGIPQVHWEGEECEYSILVLDLLGPTLEDLFNYCDRTFSLRTVLMLAEQLLRRLEHIHGKGYIHRDIKPENLLMGDGMRGNHVYVIDLGLVLPWRTVSEDKNHNEAPDGPLKLIGTADYASINAHYARLPCPRDDLESLGYIFVYFLRGSLPWEAPLDEPEDPTAIVEKKRATSIRDLCDGLPHAFVAYFEHVRGLKHNDKPKYDYLRRLFSSLFAKERYRHDDVFDWTERKYLETKVVDG